MSKSWAGGSSRAWRKIRAGVLAENTRTNGGRCTLAIARVCTGEATCVHHVRGRAVTGDDPRWLVAACRACNLHVGEPSKYNPQPRKISKW